MIKIKKSLHFLKHTYVFLILLFFYSRTTLQAEGTAQVMPNQSNGTALLIQPGTGSGPLLNATASNRIYFNINDHSIENFYFGLSFYTRTPTTGKATNGFYKIYDPSGTLVAGPTAIPSTGTGFISTYASAIAGPNVGGLNPSGYDPIIFDPSANGDYYIEIYRSSTAGATMIAGNNGEMYSTLFDFTVSESNFNLKSGRIHCQRWSFINYDPLIINFIPSTNFSFEGDYFAYTNDSSIVKVDFTTGFKPLSYILAMNNYGVNSTGNFVSDRTSVYTGTATPAFLNNYPVFLNNPDPTVYVTSVSASTPSVGSNITGTPGAYAIPYFIDKPGDVFILLDLNGTTGYQAGTSDLIFENYNTSAGNNVLNWDGLDGLGGTVASGSSIKITVILNLGRTNLPIYDAELNTNGFKVDAITPSASNRKVYWDDATLATFGICPSGASGAQQSTNNTTGAGLSQKNYFTEGVLNYTHSWDGANPTLTPPAIPSGQGSATAEACDDFGNARTINSWFWAADYTSSEQIRNLPGAPTISFHPNSTTKCIGESANFSITDNGATSWQWQEDADGPGIGGFVDLIEAGVYSNVTTTSLTISDVTGLNNHYYRCVATNVIGSINSNPATLTVNTVPITPGSIAGATSICSGSTNTYSVTAVSGAASYSWTLPGSTWTGTSTSNSIDVTTGTTSGNISVVATNSCGNSASSLQAINVKMPTVGTDVQSSCNSITWIDGNTYSTSNNTATFVLTNFAGCDSTVTLNYTRLNATTGTDVQTACDAYTWIDGNIYTTSNNTATYVLTNAVGCDSTVTLNLNINNVDVTTNIFAETITANAVAANYQWIDCNNANATIAGETNQSFTAIANGNYAVVVTQGACSDTSNCVVITSVGIKSTIRNEQSGITIMPNPNNGTFTIKSTTKGVYTLVNDLGQTIQLFELRNSNNYSAYISDLSAGIYFILGYNSEHLVKQKIVITK